MEAFELPLQRFDAQRAGRRVHGEGAQVGADRFGLGIANGGAARSLDARVEYATSQVSGGSGRGRAP
jgi:hypothetical protein